MSTEKAIAYAHDHREQFLDQMKELLAIPSISTLPEHRGDMQRAAEWLRARLNAIGLEAEIIPGAGHPLVYAEWLKAGEAPTLLIYGHYDVQPVDPIELWDTAPFEPTVRDNNIYARGSSDDKGQTLTLIDALESWLAGSGALPLNVKLIVEGEEEAGGETVTAYIEQHGDRLRADVALIADSGMFAPDIPTLETGLRGIVYTDVEVRGAAHDLHSGLYGGVAPNPFNALAHIIAGLKDLNGRITIPGFYDRVVMPPDEVRDQWRALPLDEEAVRRDEIGSSALVGEQGYTYLERTWARPTLDVHGIIGGFTGEGAKTVIPAVATAKISMRLVPDQIPDEIFQLFQERVEALTPAGITVDVRWQHGGEAVVVPVDSPYVQAATRALEETFGRPAVLARSGGSIPVVGLLKEQLGINTVLMGWGLPDDNLHAPNEKFSLDNFYRGIDATIRFLAHAADSANGS